MTVRIPRAALLPLLLVAGADTLRAQGSDVNDPYLWLEEVQASDIEHLEGLRSKD